MVANELHKKRLREATEGQLPGIHFEKVIFDELAEILEADYRLKGQKRPRVGNLKEYFKEQAYLSGHEN